jgi:hypothetical protein
MSVAKRSFFIAATGSVALMFGIAGCNKNAAPDNSAQSQSAPAQTDQAQTDQTQNPQAAANLAPASATQASNTNEQQDQSYSNDDSNGDYDTDDEGGSYGQPVLQAQQPPPQLPEYTQPDCPGDGYLWTPGYWSYSGAGYYWVPGAWARPPEVGYLWTPGYWGYAGGTYRFIYGFWAAHIGYYGGINYGNGYTGVGYQGGYWSGDRFNYNRSVNNVTITNVQVYNRTVTNTVINNVTVNNTTNRKTRAAHSPDDNADTTTASGRTKPSAICCRQSRASGHCCGYQAGPARETDRCRDSCPCCPGCTTSGKRATLSCPTCAGSSGRSCTCKARRAAYWKAGRETCCAHANTNSTCS